MNLEDEINQNGVISVTTNNKKRKTKIPQSEPQDIIDICLNCTKKKCNGNCAKIRRVTNEYKSRDN